MSDCGKPSLALGTWKRATWFNMRHMQFAWLSLVWVMVTDLYSRWAASATFTPGEYECSM